MGVVVPPQTDATQLTTGILGGARLPNPSSSVLGGVKSAATQANNWITSIGTDGVCTFGQPAFSSLSGNPTSGNITSGLGYTPANKAGDALSGTFSGATWSGSVTGDLTNATITTPATLRTTLGLGTSAIISTGTSGAVIPLLNGVNTWSAAQTFSGGGAISGTWTGTPTFTGTTVTFSQNTVANSHQGNTVYGGRARTITAGNGSIGTAFALSANVNLTGLFTATPFANYFVISNDTMDSNAGQGGNLFLQQNIAAGFKGARNSLQVQLQHTGLSANVSDALRQYTAGNFFFTSNANEGGTGNSSPNTAGFGFGMNAVATLISGATNWSGLFGAEIDTAVSSGASVGTINGLLIHISPAHAVRGGNGGDTALAINSSSGTANSGYDYGILFGSGAGQNPIYTGGSLMAFAPQVSVGGQKTGKVGVPQIVNGVDLTNLTFTGNPFRSPGFSVGSGGSVAVGNGLISTISQGIALDVPNQIVTSAAISTAGSAVGNGLNNYYPGDVMSGPAGGQYTAATTKVIAAAVTAGGTGGTNGTQTVTGTTGTGTPFQASVTVSGATITAVLSVTVPGSYTVNPTLLTAEPVTGAGLTGATLNLGIGIATLTVTVPDVSVAGTGTYSNPVTLIPARGMQGSGAGASANLTWSAVKNTLSLNPSGGAIQLGAGAFTANGSVATTMTSLGPTGAHTTIQKWLTITEADGTTIGYVPVY